MTELTFPFKNISINELVDFADAYKILHFIDDRNGDDPNKIFESYVGIYESGLPNFENELLQVINTTGQQTIDAYFNMLGGNLNDLKDIISIENIKEVVYKFNSDSLKRFENEIETETDKYFSSENRKLAHMEEYEGMNSGLFFLTHAYKTEKLINYNFYCANQKLRYIEHEYIDSYFELIIGLYNKLREVAVKYGRDWYGGKIISGVTSHIKPVLFVEGKLDIDYIKKAAEHLGEERLLSQIDIRQRGGYKNLDKLWNIFKSENWETVAQKKIFLYDCDTEKSNEDNLLNFKRIIPTVTDHPIKKGIENLFDEALIKRAIAHTPSLVDVIEASGTKRGAPHRLVTYEIDRQEKRNFCDWVCQNATIEDFKHFKTIFVLIKTIIDQEK
jgi:hypothetical protein